MYSKSKIRLTCIIFFVFFTVNLFSCGQSSENSKQESNTSISNANQSSIDISFTEESQIISVDSVESSKEEELPVDKNALNSLNFSNNGKKMGDNDGPAYAVYSKRGYNRASVELEISKIKFNNVRKSDGKYSVAYLFLGVDVYKSANGAWINCMDAGLAYTSSNGYWHLFYNIYDNPESQYGWYESQVKLNPNHDYGIMLDTSKKDGFGSVSIVDITSGNITVDTAEFELLGSLRNGSNTAYLQDYALDFPSNVKFDTDNKPSENWKEILLYNTDENVYLRNLRISNATLFNLEGEYNWTEEHTNNRGMWPDSSIGVDYAPVTVSFIKGDYEMRVDLDMNRNKNEQPE